MDLIINLDEALMNILIVYDSVFGNTEKIALHIGQGMGLQGDVQTLPVSQVKADHISGFDILVVGSPTRGFRPTEGIASFIKTLSKDHLVGLPVAAFDTRILLETIDSSLLRFMVDKGGYAASAIAKSLKRKGARLLASPEGFLVTGEQGPLQDGELERAAEWGQKLLSG
jgi:flavodoxin I